MCILVVQSPISWLYLSLSIELWMVTRRQANCGHVEQAKAFPEAECELWALVLDYVLGKTMELEHGRPQKPTLSQLGQRNEMNHLEKNYQ